MMHRPTVRMTTLGTILTRSKPTHQIIYPSLFNGQRLCIL